MKIRALNTAAVLRRWLRRNGRRVLPRSTWDEIAAQAHSLWGHA